MQRQIRFSIWYLVATLVVLMVLQSYLARAQITEITYS